MLITLPSSNKRCLNLAARSSQWSRMVKASINDTTRLALLAIRESVVTSDL